MDKFMSALRALQTEEAGLTTVEYAIAGGLIGLALVGAFTNLGTAVGGVIDAITAILPA